MTRKPVSGAEARRLAMFKARMTDDEVKDMFDTDWDMQLSQLSSLSGRSVSELKKLLMGG